MLFNSFPFIAIFLPLAWSAWHLAVRLDRLQLGKAALILASLVFYAAWDIRFLPVLLGSVIVNYAIGRRILAAPDGEETGRRWLIGGIAFNLSVLGFFKYAGFLLSNLGALFGISLPFHSLPLPLAISFVTFQKIAFLVDCRRGLIKRSEPLDYLFFVSFFPQLIAGPIVHYRPFTCQADPDANRLLKSWPAQATGLFLFAAGLFKKVVLADNLARYVAPVFALARHGLPGQGSAWQGMLAFTLQLYFDFSGYSDMALGLGLMFGIRLPFNFDSPYRSASLIEFWRRWHMTLSAFLRDYLYIPLGGNRHGAISRYRNMLITMLLGGLWHGAGWTFLLWGGLHGLLLAVNHLWRSLVASQAWLAGLWARVPKIVPRGLTFLSVALAWVLFRAEDAASAGRILCALLHPDHGPGVPLPSWDSPSALVESFLATRPEAAWLWIGLGLTLVWTLPNPARWIGYDDTPNGPWRARPGILAGLAAGGMAWFALKWMATQAPTEFLYFVF